jgi:hypothetical protein
MYQLTGPLTLVATKFFLDNRKPISNRFLTPIIYHDPNFQNFNFTLLGIETTTGSSDGSTSEASETETSTAEEEDEPEDEV